MSWSVQRCDASSCCACQAGSTAPFPTVPRRKPWGNAQQRAGGAKRPSEAHLHSGKMLFPDAKPGFVPGLLFKASGLLP